MLSQVIPPSSFVGAQRGNSWFFFWVHVLQLFISDFEVMNGNNIEKKAVNNNCESENYSDGGKEPNCVMK
jgi:hypothetical protein